VHRASILVRSDKDVDERPDEAVETRLQTVVVKVLRPQIEKIIETDLAALKTVGGWLHRYRPIRKRADVPALLGEFRRVLFEEIDYLSEGRNAETFAVNFRDYPGVRVPQVYWTHTTRSVLTLEDVFAIKITDYEQISAAGVDRKEVASLLLDTYLKQIFEDGFFHADPHPGNLFVQPLDENAVRASAKRPWLLTFVDFGMTGRVPSTLRSGLRELLIGVGTRDSKRVLHAYQKMEMLLPNADLELLERASTRVFDQYWGKNMNELASIDYQEMRDLASEFRELIYEMPFQVPQNIIFLARCVGILSGMCTGLDPEFNLWSHLAPFARKIIAEESHQVQSTWLAEAEKLARTFLSLPHQIDNALVRLERGEISVRSPEISFQVRRLTQATRGLTSALVFAVLFLGGIQLFLAGFALMGGISAGLGVLFLVNSLATSRR
jgi:predicted unusual protein kinase regulating ubiquinone biosynthesis (AarF/ABC1/UbiB family)